MIALASGGVWAENVYWTGATDTKWNNSKNWTGQNNNRPTPTKDWMYFDGDRFSQVFSENDLVVLCEGQYSCNWASVICKAGSEDQPLVFKATNDSNGLTFSGNGSNSNSHYLFIGDRKGDAHVRFETGTYKTGSWGTWKLGGSGYAAHLEADGANMIVQHQMLFNNGSLIANNANLTVENVCTVGNEESKSVTIEKTGGAWNLKNNLQMCAASNASATFLHKGGSMSVANYFAIGDKAGAGPALFEISGGTVSTTRTGSYAIIGSSSAGTLTVSDSGIFNVTGNLLIGNNENASGVLQVKDGGTVNIGEELVFAFNKTAATGVVNLDGGELSVSRMYVKNKGDNNAKVAFNGGTLKATKSDKNLIDEGVIITTGENGGTIDLQGKTVAIKEPLLEDAESTGGGMMFKGGGVVTLAEGNTYRGKTTVEVGTTVCVAKKSELDSGLVVTIPETTLEDGVYPLVTIHGEDAFSESFINSVEVPTNTRLRLSADAKSILYICGNPLNTWIGGASGSLSEAANWSLGFVPTADEHCIIGNAIAANLTNPSDSAFAPASITFPADSAVVTISGEGAISGVEEIINNASVHHVFNCRVVCKGGITPDITRGAENYMTFAGGITMYDAPKTGGMTTDHWSGNITVTTKTAQEFKSSDPKNYAALIQGTTFTFNNGIIDHLQIYPGSTAVVNRLVYEGCARSSNNYYYSYVFDNCNGVLRAKEIEAKGGAVLFHSYAGSDQQGGTIIAEKLISATTENSNGVWTWPLFYLNCGNHSVNTSADSVSAGEGVWVIGCGGLSFGSDAYARSFYGVHLGKNLDNGRPAATLHSYEDWALAEHPLGPSQNALEISSGHDELLVIDTSHYMVGDPALDVATSHTVTLNGKVKGDGNLRIEGSGKVIFANKYNTFSGGLTVTDTATVAIKAGAPLPANTTVKSGAALEVFESGAVTLGGNITLEDGAVLGFNFTDRKIVPVLEIADGKTVTFGANKAIKVLASGIKRPVAGKHILTSGGDFSEASVTLAEGAPDWVKGVSVEDGAIVLDVKPIGTVLTVR